MAKPRMKGLAEVAAAGEAEVGVDDRVKRNPEAGSDVPVPHEEASDKPAPDAGHAEPESGGPAARLAQAHGVRRAPHQRRDAAGLAR